MCLRQKIWESLHLPHLIPETQTMDNKFLVVLSGSVNEGETSGHPELPKIERWAEWGANLLT
jgi:hypothetical protein